MTIDINAIKLGYFVEGDNVIINKEMLEVIQPFNVYAEAKKFMWDNADSDYDQFTTVLILRGLVKSSEVTSSFRYTINHASTNIFATEALFKDFPNVLSLVDSEMVGYIATWMNTDLYFNDMKKLFTDFEVGQVTVEEILPILEKYKNEFKELV